MENLQTLNLGILLIIKASALEGTVALVLEMIEAGLLTNPLQIGAQ